MIVYYYWRGSAIDPVTMDPLASMMTDDPEAFRVWVEENIPCGEIHKTYNNHNGEWFVYVRISEKMTTRPSEIRAAWRLLQSFPVY